MKSINCRIVPLLALLLLSPISGYIFEANNRDEIGMFVDDDPAEYRALLFYDFDQYDDKIDQVQSIFDDPYDPTWIGESWIRDLKDGAHLMRINAREDEFERIVEDYDIGVTPRVIVYHDSEQFVDEVLDEETYDNIKKYIIAHRPKPIIPVAEVVKPPQPAVEPVRESVKEPVYVVPEPVYVAPQPVVAPVQQWNCPPVPDCNPKGPTPAEVQRQCEAALESTLESASEAVQAYEDLKREFEAYKEAVEAEKAAEAADLQRYCDRDAIEESEKDIDLFIHLRDSLKNLDEIQRQSRELEDNLRDAKRQVDYRMDDWMRKYQRDYMDLHDRQISSAEYEGYHEGYDEGFEAGHKKGKREGEDDAKKNFIDHFFEEKSFSQKEYKEEYGLDIIGEPRLIGQRLIEKGEPHDNYTIEEYDLGSPLNRIYNITPGFISPAHPNQRFIAGLPHDESFLNKTKTSILPKTQVKNKISHQSKKAPAPKATQKPIPVPPAPKSHSKTPKPPITSSKPHSQPSKPLSPSPSPAHSTHQTPSSRRRVS